MTGTKKLYYAIEKHAKEREGIIGGIYAKKICQMTDSTAAAAICNSHEFCISNERVITRGSPDLRRGVESDPDLYQRVKITHKFARKFQCCCCSAVCLCVLKSSTCNLPWNGCSHFANYMTWGNTDENHPERRAGAAK